MAAVIAPTMPKKPTAKPKVKKPRTFATGGGNATASGVNFQQSLGALFGLWMLGTAYLIVQDESARPDRLGKELQKRREFRDEPFTP